MGIYNETFALKVRWKSEIGKVCQEKLKLYISDQVNTSTTPFIFNFYLFSFLFNGKTYDLDNFKRLFDTSYLSSDITDLRGIDLSNVQIHDCHIRNCSFEDATFNYAFFINVGFKNTNFQSASFRNAWLRNINLEKSTNFSAVDLTASIFYEVKNMNISTFSEPPIYKEVSWSWLVSSIYKRIIKKKKLMIPTRHTSFGRNNTENLTGSEQKEFREYVIWHQYVMRRLEQFKDSPFLKKCGFVLAVLSTKFWSSIGTLAIFAATLDIIFTFLIFLFRQSFHHLGVFTLGGQEYTLGFWKTLLHCFYYSTVTFTTLGYGDIFPDRPVGQIIVIIEAITGYVTLGLFLLLVSRRVDKQY